MSFKDCFTINRNNAAVIGLQFGDEGKGKVVDLLAEDFDYVARFQGGDNAGHTIVINNKTYKLSLIPSGVFQGKKVILGSGVVINPYKLKEEIQMLNDLGIDLNGKLFISDIASIIFSISRKLDVLIESSRSEAIGTTGKGIGVAYSHRVARFGIRVCDLFNKNKEKLANRLKNIVDEYNNIASRSEDFDQLYNFDDILKEVEIFKQILLPHTVNSAEFFNEIIKNNGKILFEGAQGCGLDVNHGTYPFVTSSSTFVAQVALGSPISFQNIGKVYGVLKAYSTRVGHGVLVTENYTDENVKDAMQTVGQEFGTVTGRQRRCGWLDLVSVKTYIKVNGVSSIILTKIDVLDQLEKIKICIGYEIDGQRSEYLPSVIEENISPIYEEFDGWKSSTIGIKKYEDLPENTRKYIEFIENFLETRIEIVSNGAGRDEVIRRKI